MKNISTFENWWSNEIDDRLVKIALLLASRLIWCVPLRRLTLRLFSLPGRTFFLAFAWQLYRRQFIFIKKRASKK